MAAAVFRGAQPSAVALTTGLCSVLGSVRSPKLRAGAAGRGLDCSLAGYRLQGRGDRCPLHCPPFFLAPLSRLWPRPRLPSQPAGSASPARPPAGAAGAARGFIYIVSLVAASPCRGRRGCARLPGFALRGGSPRFWGLGERMCELIRQVCAARSSCVAPPPRPQVPIQRGGGKVELETEELKSCMVRLCPKGERERSTKLGREMSNSIYFLHLGIWGQGPRGAWI